MDYISKFVPESIKQIPLFMDFDGQRRAEKMFQIIIVLFATVGFIWGYICQQFSQTIYILFAGFLFACLMTLPPWPMYRRKPLSWQPARDYDNISDDTSTVKQNNLPAVNSKANKRKK
jgi:signal peptidase complex subunit 1